MFFVFHFGGNSCSLLNVTHRQHLTLNSTPVIVGSHDWRDNYVDSSQFMNYFYFIVLRENLIEVRWFTANQAAHRAQQSFCVVTYRDLFSCYLIQLFAAFEYLSSSILRFLTPFVAALTVYPDRHPQTSRYMQTVFDFLLRLQKHSSPPQHISRGRRNCLFVNSNNRAHNVCQACAYRRGPQTSAPNQVIQTLDVPISRFAHSCGFRFSVIGHILLKIQRCKMRNSCHHAWSPTDIDLYISNWHDLTYGVGVWPDRMKT